MVSSARISKCEREGLLCGASEEISYLAPALIPSSEPPQPQATYVLSEVSAPSQGPEFKGSVKHLKKGIPLRKEAFFFHEMRQGKRAPVLQD